MTGEAHANTIKIGASNDLRGRLGDRRGLTLSPSFDGLLGSAFITSIHSTMLYSANPWPRRRPTSPPCSASTRRSSGTTRTRSCSSAWATSTRCSTRTRRWRAALLELTLTARGKGTEHVVPMCGVPAPPARRLHGAARAARASASPSATRSRTRGRPRAWCAREVVRVVTPGTVIDPSSSRPRTTPGSPASRAPAGAGRGVPRRLDRRVPGLGARAEEADGWEALARAAARFRAARDRLPGGARLAQRPSARGPAAARSSTHCEPFGFDARAARRAPGAAVRRRLARRLRPARAARRGRRRRAACSPTPRRRSEARLAARRPARIFHQPSRHLLLDPATRRNLELERSLRDGGREGSLCSRPSTRRITADGRQAAAALAPGPADRPGEIAPAARRGGGAGAPARPARALREALAGVHDSSACWRAGVAGTATPRDLAALRASLAGVPPHRRGRWPGCARRRCCATRWRSSIPCRELLQRLATALADEPPAALRRTAA